MTLPCPLQILDRGTGEVMKAALDVHQVPLINLLRKFVAAGEVAVCIDASCADRAAANGRVENAMYEDSSPRLRFRLPCFAHIAATSQSRGFSCCEEDVSALIALSLTMDVAGSVSALRNCVSAVLLDSIAGIADLPPHVPSHPYSVRLHHVLATCLPGNDDARRTALRLKELLTGDTAADRFVLRVPGGVLDRVSWADEVALLVLPRKFRPSSAIAGATALGRWVLIAFWQPFTICFHVRGRCGSRARRRRWRP